MWETGRSSEVRADTVGTSKDGDLARSNISLGSSGVMGVMSLTWRFRQGNFGGKGGGVLTMITACTRSDMVQCMYNGDLSGGVGGYGHHGMRSDGARLGEGRRKRPFGWRAVVRLNVAAR